MHVISDRPSSARRPRTCDEYHNAETIAKNLMEFWPSGLHLANTSTVQNAMEVSAQTQKIFTLAACATLPGIRNFNHDR